MQNVLVPTTASRPIDDQFIIRPLTSADIQNIRALHAELAPSSPTLNPTFFHQLLTHPTRLCLIATLPSSSKPVACIAVALHVRTSDLSSASAQLPPVEVHVLALGVRPEFRRQGIARRLLHDAATSLRALAVNAPHIPSALVGASTETRVSVDVARADGSTRAFWKHVGMDEEEREPWQVGWRDVVSVTGPVLAAA
ncbi:acyl-CoA N-acyltransferase [Gloeopeniophorella convolvens]|nr:acyl-CoA N-acyltransferase [Gloeopeniophorella convolvens]